MSFCWSIYRSISNIYILFISYPIISVCLYIYFMSNYLLNVYLMSIQLSVDLSTDLPKTYISY